MTNFLCFSSHFHAQELTNVMMSGWKASRRLAIACCKVYISDSRNRAALDAIENAAKGNRLAPLLHVFDDKEYNRVGYTLTGSLPPENAPVSELASLPLHVTVTNLVKAAVANINLVEHSGTHPRLGVVDHICFNALGTATLEEVKVLARTLASDIATNLQVPTFLYGAAHPEGRSLDAIRRSLGYFRSDPDGNWKGSPELESTLAPEFGPSKASPETGVMIVGASPWVMNYNVPLLSTDLNLAKKIARKVSQRGGGLPWIQTMALRHGDDQCEIACNLLDVDMTGPEVVQEKVELLSGEEGLEVKRGYLTGHSKDDLLEMAVRTQMSTVFGREKLSQTV